MTPYRKGAGHSRVWYLTLTDAKGTPHRVSTGTHDRATADEMDTMLRALTRRGTRDWDLVRALLERHPEKKHRRRLALATLYDHWRAGTLDRLRAELADLDLAPGIDAWCAIKRPENTRRAYVRRIALLAPTDAAGARLPLWRSQLTPEYVAERRDAIEGGYWAVQGALTAWSSCCAYLVDRRMIAENPVAKVQWPKKPAKASEARHIARLADVQRFVAALPTAEMRALAALREGVGADADALDPMRRDHIVDEQTRTVFLPGDKTHNRAREVEVEPWAWAHVAAYLATPEVRAMMPGALLFRVPQTTYNLAHRRACAALRAAGAAIPVGYTPHNGRHSFAVRKRRAGWPDWKIAAYLGNTPQEVARTYGRFLPTRDDMRQSGSDAAPATDSATVAPIRGAR